MNKELAYDARHDTMIVVTLLDTVTGEVRKSPPHPEEWGDNAHSTYWWTEGNGGCDCNRQIVFEGPDVMWKEDDTYDGGHQCRSERYRVIAVEPLLEGYTLADFNDGYPEYKG